VLFLVVNQMVWRVENQSQQSKKGAIRRKIQTCIFYIWLLQIQVH